MNSSFLEQYVKAKDYVLRKELFPLIWEYKLNLEEVLLLIYFMNEDVPTFDVEQINKITMISVNKILDSFTSLTNKGLISIDVIKENSGVKEVVNLDPIYKCMIDGLMKNNKKVVNNNIFEKFEKEFSRTLSPMEYEIINDWLDKNTSEELILGALKEATYNGVNNLRYIDKIIYEWNKKGFKNMEDVNNHLRNRNTSDKSVKEISDYNWLDE
ncbi:MAG: DnaD domain protein [Tenericutes bacterium]|nr:DnaD domain protein [Mycoplasmatota bacterium]